MMRFVTDLDFQWNFGTIMKLRLEICLSKVL